MEDYTPSEPVKYTFRQRLENFWYHYKWHTVVSVFLIIAITVCSLQFCSKNEYDIYVMYAGPYNATQSEVLDMQSSLQSVCEDYNEDGQPLVNISNLFLMTREQIDEKNASLGQGYEVNEQLIADNSSIFNQQIQIGEYMILLLDPVWVDFLSSENEEDNYLMKISELLPAESTHTLYGDRGVYLSSTGLYTMPGLCNLPDNTVLCIRKAGFGVSEEAHGHHTDFFKKLLS